MVLVVVALEQIRRPIVEVVANLHQPEININSTIYKVPSKSTGEF